jgi:hypothetical protein
MQNNKINIEDQLSYYLREGSGIFAYALAKLFNQGKIYILSDLYGEDWSDDIPYEVTHVYFSPGKKILIDAKGCRSESAMAKDFALAGGNYKIIGGFEPNDFKKNFMGSSDKYPLFGKKSDIILAENIIRNNSELYLPKR